MKTYVYGKTAEIAADSNTHLAGICVIDLQKTWDKLVLAARVLAAIPDPASIYCVGQRLYAQRAIIKFAKETGATAAPGRFTPGQFTNQVTQQFVEPRILVVADPRNDNQAIKESSYVNIPVIAFCGTDSPLDYVDIAIPCNNRGKESLGLLYWMLAREVLRIRNRIGRGEWGVMVDLFFHKDESEIKEQIEAEKEQEQEYGNYDESDFIDGDFGLPDNAAAAPAVAENEFATEWENGAQGQPQNQPQVQEQWGTADGTAADDWGAQQNFNDQGQGDQDWGSGYQQPAAQQQYYGGYEQGQGQQQQQYQTPGGFQHEQTLDEWDN